MVVEVGLEGRGLEVASRPSYRTWWVKVQQEEAGHLVAVEWWRRGWCRSLLIHQREKVSKKNYYIV